MRSNSREYLGGFTNTRGGFTNTWGGFANTGAGTIRTIRMTGEYVNPINGMDDTQFPHTFNSWFKLTLEASGIQEIMSDGSD
jgi:hypothetical protein